MPFQPQIRLVAATVPLLNALNDDRSLFGELIGSPVPNDWPEFPAAIGFTLDDLQRTSERLTVRGRCSSSSTTRAGSLSALVASPLRHRGGLLRSATTWLLSSVVTGTVPPPLGRWSNVLWPAARLTTSSRTPGPAPKPSTGVLVSLDVEHVADQQDPEVGLVWPWRWARSLVG
jgi:hypothetical protein